jgi:DNA-binding response OmpR family regulator
MPAVLIVDDSPVARRALTQRLHSEGYEVIEAASVAAARKVDAYAFGCAIVDLELPDGDGTDLARFLAERRASLPIAFFTQGTSPSLVEDARNRGTVFKKPDMAPLVAWVKRAVRTSQPPPTK